jgi:hypothetical protein
MTDLQNCPFCGSDASAEGVVRYSDRHVNEQGWEQNEFYYCNCPRCGVNNCGIVGHSSREKAIEAWNRRASKPSTSTAEAEPVAYVGQRHLTALAAGEDPDAVLWRHQNGKGTLVALYAHPSPSGDGENGELDAGINYAIERLCEIFDVDPKSISWDAATETMDGDVRSVFCNVMVAAYGEEWSSSARDTAKIRAALATPLTEGGERNAVIEECAKAAERAAATQSQFQKSAYDRGDDIGGHGHWKAQGELLNLATTLRALKSGAPDA